MTAEEKISLMQEMLEAVVNINTLLLEFHDLPILAKLNKEIQTELEKIKK